MKKEIFFAGALLVPAMAIAQTEGDYAHQLTDVAVRLDGGNVVAAGGAVTGGTCTNQVVTALDTSGVPTCSSLADAMVSSNTFTLGKLAFAATARLACRSTAAAGAGEECTVTSPVTLSGGALSLAVTAANDGGAIAKQASSPGTTQTTAHWHIDGIGRVTHDALGTTSDDALYLENTTAASGGAVQQMSPGLRLTGSAWNSSGSASELDSFRIYTQPNTNAGATTATLRIDASIAGAAFGTSRFSLTSAGNLTLAGNLNTGTSIQAGTNFIAPTGGSGRYTFNAHGGLDDVADGSTQFENNAGTVNSYTSGVLSGGSVVKMGSLVIPSGTTSAVMTYGSSTEVLTIAAAATTDSANSLLPANSIIDAVAVRVTTVIPTAATFTVGDNAGNATRFIDGTNIAAVSSAATSTGVGLNQWNPAAATFGAGPAQVAAAKVRITPNATPGAATGVVRITVWWHTFTAPAS